MMRTRTDFNNARKRRNLNLFTKYWTQIRRQWFIYEPGGDRPDQAKLTFHFRLLASDVESS